MASNRDKIQQFKQGGERKTAVLKAERIKKLVSQCAHRRGDETEMRVKEALEFLKNEGRILSFYMTEKWGREDKRGIDAVIYLIDGSEECRQIKGSLAGVRKHLEQQELHKEKIGVIYGNYLAGETFEEYKERIFRNISGGAELLADPGEIPASE